MMKLLMLLLLASTDERKRLKKILKHEQPPLLRDQCEAKLSMVTPPPRYTDFFNLRLVANGKKIHTTFTDRGYLDVATAVHLLLTYPNLTAMATFN